MVEFNCLSIGWDSGTWPTGQACLERFPLSSCEIQIGEGAELAYEEQKTPRNFIYM